MRAFVIAISGISGSGKSTVCEQIARRIHKTAVVRFEDYLGFQRLNYKWLFEGGNFNSLDLEALRCAADAAARKSKNDCVLIDYPLGRCNECMNKVIDFAFYIDVPPDVALARRLTRDIRAGGEKVRSTIALYKDYGYKISRKIVENVPKTVDVTVNGLNDIDELADWMSAYIDCLLRNSFLFTDKKSLPKRK